MALSPAPTRIDQASPTEMLLTWSTGESFAVPYVELRFLCPCAGCVSEHTGERTITRESIPSDIRPKGVHLVGRYAVQVDWSDDHATGMYSFERLYEISRSHGRAIVN